MFLLFIFGLDFFYNIFILKGKTRVSPTMCTHFDHQTYKYFNEVFSLAPQVRNPGYATALGCV